MMISICMKHLQIDIITIILCVSLFNCTPKTQLFEPEDGPPTKSINFDNISDPIPRWEPPSRGGNPKSYSVMGKRYFVAGSSENYVETGIASWYGTKFHGRKTSNGETYDMFAMSAAHKTLPLPTYVRVTNLENKRTIIVRINDRGPFHQNRIIDLSYAAAGKLGIDKTGTGFVEIRAITPTNNASIQSAQEKIYLQVGAFSDHSNAIKLKDNLNLPNFPGTRIQATKSRYSDVYKVQIGPLASVVEADHLIQQLTKLGHPNSYYVTENN